MTPAEMDALRAKLRKDKRTGNDSLPSKAPGVPQDRRSTPDGTSGMSQDMDALRAELEAPDEIVVYRQVRYTNPDGTTDTWTEYRYLGTRKSAGHDLRRRA